MIRPERYDQGYEAVLPRLHLVNPKTGRVIGEEDDE
jgi:hypothetical protein